MQQHSPAPEQVFAPPVIGRDGSKQRKTKAYKAPKQVQPRQKDDRSLKGYVYLGLAITVLLGGVMSVWLWLLSPDKGARGPGPGGHGRPALRRTSRSTPGRTASGVDVDGP